MTHPRAGQPAEPEDLIDVSHLVTTYFAVRPDPDDPRQQVAFGTSGHRGSSLDASFNEAHILATTQAICEYRAAQGYDGPLFLGRDTHGAVRAGLGQRDRGAGRERRHGAGRRGRRLHPDAGGVARDPARQRRPDDRARAGRRHRGHAVAQPAARRRLQVQPAARRPGRHRRHRLDRRRGRTSCSGRRPGRRPPHPVRPRAGRRASRTTSWAPTSTTCRPCSTSTPSATAGVRIGADPLGGASVDYWGAIAERHRLDLTVVNPLVDPTWRFMTLDWDGKIRMDCSSPYAMASLIAQQGRLTRSRPATTPTPTGTGSSRPTAG